MLAPAMAARLGPAPGVSPRCRLGPRRHEPTAPGTRGAGRGGGARRLPRMPRAPAAGPPPEAGSRQQRVDATGAPPAALTLAVQEPSRLGTGEQRAPRRAEEIQIALPPGQRESHARGGAHGEHRLAILVAELVGYAAHGACPLTPSASRP